jgi:hypothetical protein
MTDQAATFDPAAFFKALDATVLARGLHWKDVSTQTGVSTSTLSRMAQGRGPDAASQAILAAWAELNPADFTHFPAKKTFQREPLALLSSTLRKDPRLSADAAEALEAVIRATYERLAQPIVATGKNARVKKP